VTAGVTAVAALMAVVPAGCGTSRRPEARAAKPHSQPPSKLVAAARPIGRGPGFETTPRGPIVGHCRRMLGPRYGVHVEVFARNRVVLFPAGIGARAPTTGLDGRVNEARCYGELVTLDPTGLVLVRPETHPTLGDLFRSWGQRLSSRTIGAFRAPAGTEVEAFLNGRRWRGRPASLPLRRHDEVVVEVSPFVPPHSAYAFPPRT